MGKHRSKTSAPASCRDPFGARAPAGRLLRIVNLAADMGGEHIPIYYPNAQIYSPCVFPFAIRVGLTSNKFCAHMMNREAKLVQVVPYRINAGTEPSSRLKTFCLFRSVVDQLVGLVGGRSALSSASSLAACVLHTRTCVVGGKTTRIILVLTKGALILGYLERYSRRLAKYSTRLKQAGPTHRRLRFKFRSAMVAWYLHCTPSFSRSLVADT